MELFQSFIILQFIAHFLSDFTFQTNKIAVNKNAKGLKTKYLYIHILVTFLFSYLLSFQWNFIMGAVSIALLHFMIDATKSYAMQKKIFIKYLFYIDQFLHFIIIILVVYFFQQKFTISDNLDIEKKYLLAILGFIITAKPANILIKEIFKTFNISVGDGGNIGDLPNAGKLIGIIERWLILIFVIIGQFEAVGFLLASKSILRYGDKDSNNPQKTEYVLIGTLLSFAIAVVVGLIIIKLK